MSEIDSYTHGFAGYFGGIPVYVLEQDAPSFKAKAGTVMIGGGSGEHNEMKLTNNDQAVLSFLESYAGYWGEDSTNMTKELEAAIDKINNQDLIDMNDIKHYGQLLDYSWSMSEIAEFHENFFTLRNPFDHKSFELVIIESLGEIIMHSLPGLMSEGMRKLVLSLDGAIGQAYENILTIPRGMPSYLGRRPGEGMILGWSAYDGRYAQWT